MKKVKLCIPVSGAAFWVALVRELSRKGISVKVVSELSDAQYRERGNGLYAYWIRFRMLVMFPLRVLGVALFSRRRRGQVFLVPTTPFYLPALCALLLRPLGIRVVHLLYDLYPDQLYLSGSFKASDLLPRMIARVTACSIRRSNMTVYLGKRLKQYAESTYAVAPQGHIIEVGADGALFEDNQLSEVDIPTILYSGNFGYAHDVDTLLGLFQEPISSGCSLLFHANGAGYQRLKSGLLNIHGNESIHLKGSLSEEKWVAVLCNAQIALVTMKNGAENVLFPSKTYSAMLAGQAILAICPNDSDLADTVNAADCGWVVAPGNVDGLRDAIAEIAGKPQVLLQKRLNAKRFSMAHYDMSVIAEKWVQLLAQLN